MGGKCSSHVLFHRLLANEVPPVIETHIDLNGQAKEIQSSPNFWELAVLQYCRVFAPVVIDDVVVLKLVYLSAPTIHVFLPTNVGMS